MLLNAFLGLHAVSLTTCSRHAEHFFRQTGVSDSLCRGGDVEAAKARGGKLPGVDVGHFR